VRGRFADISANTFVGHGELTVRAAAEWGRMGLEDMLTSIREMVEHGVLHWSPAEDRVVSLDRSDDGEVIH
jgi:hypothetical protein